MWVRTQDGELVNLDMALGMLVEEDSIVADMGDTEYILGTYGSPEAAKIVMNKLAIWINTPSSKCVFFMPGKEGE